MDNFVYYGPTKLLFGRGQFENLASEILPYGKNILFVYGEKHIKENGVYDRAVKMLKSAGIAFTEHGGERSNPKLDFVHEGVRICREKNIDFVLAIGGGSASDAAKAIAAGARNSFDIWNSFVDFHTRVPDSEKKYGFSQALPVGVVMTKAGTGSDFDLTAVLTNQVTREKLILMNPALYPKFTISDPTLTFSLPADQTAFGAADMMTHYFEQYFNLNEDTIVLDRLKEAALSTVIDSAKAAIDSPGDYAARSNLMYVSSWSCSAQIIVGVVPEWSSHFIEHELTAATDLNHGLGMAIVYPSWMKYVIENSPSKFAQYGERVLGICRKGRRDIDVGSEAIEKTKEYWSSLGIPDSLRKVGIDASILPECARKAVRFGPLGIVKALNEDDVLNILKAAY